MTAPVAVFLSRSDMLPHAVMASVKASVDSTAAERVLEDRVLEERDLKSWFMKISPGLLDMHPLSPRTEQRSVR